MRRARAAEAARAKLEREKAARAEAARVRSERIEEVLAIGRPPSPPPKPTAPTNAAAQAAVERTPTVTSMMDVTNRNVATRCAKALMPPDAAREVIDLVSEDEEEVPHVEMAAAHVPEVINLLSSDEDEEKKEKAAAKEDAAAEHAAAQVAEVAAEEEEPGISLLLGAMSINDKKLPPLVTSVPTAAAAATDSAPGGSAFAAARPATSRVPAARTLPGQPGTLHVISGAVTAAAPSRALPSSTPVSSPTAAPPMLCHWSTAFLPCERALGRWRDEPGRLLLLCLEAADQSSLHLVRHVYPHPAVRELLSHPRVLPVRVDGGRDAERAEAHFWLREVGGAVLPSLALLWGASGKLVIHKRKLDPAAFARQLKQILTEMGGCGGGGQGGDGGGGSRQDASGGDGNGRDYDTGCGRVGGGGGFDCSGSTQHVGSMAHALATKLLVTYRRESALGFRPPTTKRQPEIVHPTQQELDRQVRAEIDAAYNASLLADQEREAISEKVALEMAPSHGVVGVAPAMVTCDTQSGKELQSVEDEGGVNANGDVHGELSEEESPPPLTLEQIREARMAFYATHASSAASAEKGVDSE